MKLCLTCKNQLPKYVSDQKNNKINDISKKTKKFMELKINFIIIIRNRYRYVNKA